MATTINDANFKKDLKLGLIYETIALKLSNNKSYEVKALLKVYKYNSIFVEDSAYKKPSGISVSQANFYIFVLINNAVVKQTIVISTVKLKRLINEKKYEKYYVDPLKSGYLFNL
jgi:hypothetical protein